MSQISGGNSSIIIFINLHFSQSNDELSAFYLPVKILLTFP